MHSLKVFHRDIKPENILIFDDRIKLGDLGAAKSINNAEDESFTRIGTCHYMAPELKK